MIPQITFRGYKCDVKIRAYSNNDRKALVLMNAEDYMEDDMIPVPAGMETIAYATVNIPEYPLLEDEVIIKDYSENEGMYEILVQAGIISKGYKQVRTGYVSAPVCKLLITE